LIEAGVRAPVVLVDDFGAELSAEYQHRLAAVLKTYHGQVFISAFEVPPAFRDAERSVFHVEHGHASFEASA
jgi:DNA replication and repair protein RecF